MARKPKKITGPHAQAEEASTATEANPQPQDTTTKPRQPIADLFDLMPESVNDSEIQNVVNRHVDFTLGKHTIATNYDVLFLYDSIAIGRFDADRIYQAVSKRSTEKPILLIVTSGGGDVAAAYLIAKLCREYSAEHFEVVIPRQAKSAATLIACGADRIHMGSLSELGPIDPQFGNIPALALKNSVEHLAALAQAHPEASEMFASYLSRSLRVEALGYYERVAESAVQYAIRLLDKRSNAGSRAAADIAATLVYDYKDHGFVIDAAEAAGIFGNEVVVVNTAEYKLGNDIYNALQLAEWVVGWRFSKDLAFTGGASGCMVRAKKQD